MTFPNDQVRSRNCREEVDGQCHDVVRNFGVGLDSAAPTDDNERNVSDREYGLLLCCVG